MNASLRSGWALAAGVAMGLWVAPVEGATTGWGTNFQNMTGDTVYDWHASDPGGGLTLVRVVGGRLRAGGRDDWETSQPGGIASANATLDSGNAGGIANTHFLTVTMDFTGKAKFDWYWTDGEGGKVGATKSIASVSIPQLDDLIPGSKLCTWEVRNETASPVTYNRFAFGTVVAGFSELPEADPLGLGAGASYLIDVSNFTIPANSFSSFAAIIPDDPGINYGTYTSFDAGPDPEFSWYVQEFVVPEPGGAMAVILMCGLFARRAQGRAR